MGEVCWGLRAGQEGSDRGDHCFPKFGGNRVGALTEVCKCFDFFAAMTFVGCPWLEFGFVMFSWELIVYEFEKMIVGCLIIVGS